MARAKDAGSVRSLSRHQIPTKADTHHAGNPQHERLENHKPNTSTEDEDYYVLTLWTDDAHHEAITTLRRQWFPTRLLKVDAHITLFHALPGSKLYQLKQDIAAIAECNTKFDITAKREGVYEMGKGVGIRVSEGQRKAARLQAELRDKWKPFLSRQDQQERWKGHYTIMNKEDDKARVLECLRELRNGYEDNRGTVNGFNLWRYDRGWWREVEAFPFRQDSGTAQ
ncbi:hypothetical protein ACHAPT_008191 [Fusarium lateritium]